MITNYRKLAVKLFELFFSYLGFVLTFRSQVILKKKRLDVTCHFFSFFDDEPMQNNCFKNCSQNQNQRISSGLGLAIIYQSL